MEELKAMYRVCSLIKSDGIRCGSPALTGGNFCFQHIGGRLPKPKTESETSIDSTPLKFVYPDSHAALQHNLFLVVQALNERKIDNRTANTYNRLFRACELNLRKCEAANGKEEKESVQQPAESVQQPAESVQQETDENVQQAADPEPDTDPDAERDNSVHEAERRFREWQQSPQGQAFTRMHRKLNPHLRSLDPRHESDPHSAPSDQASEATAGNEVEEPALSNAKGPAEKSQRRPLNPAP